MREPARSASLMLAIASLLTLGACGATLPGNAGPSCQKQAVHTLLHVDPSDPRQTWGTDFDTARSHLVRPRGDTAWRIDPAHDVVPSRLVDASGRMLASDHDIFYEACIDLITGTYYVGAEDLPGPRGPT